MAVSNIHYNLTAWQASHVYTSGTSISNGGNAYRVTTSGTSASSLGPTGTGSAITDGTVVWKFLSAINFTNLQAWANALPTTLTQSMTAQLWNNNGTITTTVSTPYLTLSGHTTTPTNNIIIRAAPGESLADLPAVPLYFNAANGVSFTLPASGIGGVNYFGIFDDNVVWQGIQILDPNSTSGSTQLLGAQNITVQSALFDGFSQTGGATMITGVLGGASTSKFKVLNSVIVDRAATGTGAKTINTNYPTALANVTQYAPNNPTDLVGFAYDGPTGTSSTATNCLMLGYAAANVMLTAVAGATITAAFCLFTAASLTGGGVTTGSGNLFSKTATNQFVSTTTDLKIKIGADALDVGTTDTTDIPFATDFFGTVRPQGTAWDMGAYELPAPQSVGTAAGVATVSGVGIASKRASGSAAGAATVLGIPSGTFAVGTATGAATVHGVSGGITISVGRSAGSASVLGFSAVGAIGAVIEIDPIPPQPLNTAFEVSGTYTIAPVLLFSDDGLPNAAPIPTSGIGTLGGIDFSFIHPGLATPGSQQLVVADASSGASTGIAYRVVFTAASSPFPPQQPPVTTILPAYAYQEYADDDNVQAFFAAYNGIAQTYLDWFNSVGLPIYTGLSGDLLDWVAEGLYGIKRPVVAVTQTVSDQGTFNTFVYDSLTFDGRKVIQSATLFNVTDEIFKRIITWSFYKGDGKIFSIRWLKRRIMRFLAGLSGTAPNVDETYQVSVTFSGPDALVIQISSGSAPTTYAPVLQAAITSGVLPLPFQYSVNVLLT